MSGQLQLRRGTTAENDAFTGAEGELSYDTQAKQLRIHDGSTMGGKKIDQAADYVTAYQHPTSGNNYTWYRRYKSGWVEQGGIVPNGQSPKADTTYTITLPIRMNSSSYTIFISGACADTSNNSVGVQYGSSYYGVIWGSTKTRTSFGYRTCTGGSWVVFGMAA